jgi:hypothetical protein
MQSDGKTLSFRHVFVTFKIVLFYCKKALLKKILRQRRNFETSKKNEES